MNTIEIKGKVNTALCYATIVEDEAIEQLSMEEYKEAMKGIYTSSVCEATIDEASMAYKSLEDIIDVIKESVEIIDVMKPIYNFKVP
nr:hypothetical protein [Butyrivibrio sp. MC2021]